MNKFLKFANFCFNQKKLYLTTSDTNHLSKSDTYWSFLKNNVISVYDFLNLPFQLVLRYPLNCENVSFSPPVQRGTLCLLLYKFLIALYCVTKCVNDDRIIIINTFLIIPFHRKIYTEMIFGEDETYIKS